MLSKTLLSILALALSINAWGPEGHQIIATIAEIYTAPKALERVCAILNNTAGSNVGGVEVANQTTPSSSCSLAAVSTWADENKKKMAWSIPLHYIGAINDNPPLENGCLFPGAGGWSNPNVNILSGIHNTTQILLEHSASTSVSAPGDSDMVEGGGPLVEEALKFIVHLIADLHMPLHTTSKYLGGNGQRICFNGQQTNLHVLWDDILPSLAISKAQNATSSFSNTSLPISLTTKVDNHLQGSNYDAYVRQLIYEGIESTWSSEISNWISCPSTPLSNDGGIKADTNFICPYHWAIPTHTLVCEHLWPKQLLEDPSTYDASRQCLPLSINGKKGKKAKKVLYEMNNEDYMGPIEDDRILDKQLVMGGLRLAATLNYIFGDGDSGSFVEEF